MARPRPPNYEDYLMALRRACSDDATRQFVRVLQLHARYRPETIAAALEQALRLPYWSADAADVLIWQATDPATVASMVDLVAVPCLAPLRAFGRKQQPGQILAEGLTLWGA